MSSIVLERNAEVVLYDEQRMGRYDPDWFDADVWRERGAKVHSTTGRGSVLMLDRGNETWVLRHYHRGGLVANFVYDHYIWLGLHANRAFREWRILAELHAGGFAVPEPLAARVKRAGLLYQADILTRYLPDTRTLSALLRDGQLKDADWQAIGAMVRGFHERGVDHPDLTAHNILLDGAGQSFLVDFDNAKLRPPGAWSERGLARLQRSLCKVALETGTEFDPVAWEVLERSYRSFGREGSVAETRDQRTRAGGDRPAG